MEQSIVGILGLISGGNFKDTYGFFLRYSTKKFNLALMGESLETFWILWWNYLKKSR